MLDARRRAQLRLPMSDSPRSYSMSNNGQCPRFLFGEAFDQFDGGFARAVAFVDIRRAAAEWQLQAGQQIPAIDRAGSE